MSEPLDERERWVLLAVAARPGQTPTEVAAAAGLSVSAVVQAARVLSRRLLLRRAVTYELGPDGAAALVEQPARAGGNSQEVEKRRIARQD